MNVPATLAELDQAANLPFHEANGLIAQADKALVEQWGRARYHNFGYGYMHSSDHYAALVVLYPGQEPTFKAVYDSLHLQGSKNIDAARIKESGGNRPSGWDDMDATARRYAVLVHRYKMVKGSKILDGKIKDPDPAGTEALLREWSGGTVTPSPPPPPEPPIPEPPVPPTPPVPEPPIPSPSLSISGELRLKVGETERVFRIQEVTIP